jgi:hypothetical protein
MVRDRQALARDREDDEREAGLKGPSRRERWDANDVWRDVQVEAAAAIDDPNLRA